MEHVNGWCFRGIYKGGLWENDLHDSARIRILIGTTVVRIKILIGTTVVRIASAIRAEIHKYYGECDWSKKWAEGLQKILT